MEIDVDHQVGAVTRRVEAAEREGKPAKVATVARTYPTPIEDLWDAVTTLERIPRWFLPVTGDLHVGGHYQLEGNAGGEILTCDPPNGFEITWEYGGDVSWVIVELHGQPGGDSAQLELHHVAHVPDDLWDQFGPGAVGIGWDLGLLGLDLHIASRKAVDRAEVEAWQTSDNARDFVTRSSAAWRDASIDGGTDPDAARAAAERVTAAYTGTS